MLRQLLFAQIKLEYHHNITQPQTTRQRYGGKYVVPGSQPLLSPASAYPKSEQ